MRIAEIFHSIQGEGEFAGTPSVFVRTSGCNLRCWFCDTPYTSWAPEGAHQSWRVVLQQVCRYDCEHVVLTGGEPFLPRDIVPLSRELARRRRFITIETAGTVYRQVHADLLSISPKLANSTPLESGNRWTARHEQRRDQRAVMSRLLADYRCQLKFVVDRAPDLAEIAAYVAAFPEIAKDQVWLMPQATTRETLAAQAAWLIPEAARLGYRYANRLHIELHGNARGV